jgi:hypothetical protein
MIQRRTLLTALTALPLKSWAQDKPTLPRPPLPKRLRCVYGISANAEPFKSLAKNAIPDFLRKHGFNAVFTSHSEDQEVLSLLRENRILCFEEITIFAGRTLYRDNPAYRPITQHGQEMKPDGWYYGLCPNQPALRQKRLNDFKNRLSNPFVQGLWLDFIRYPVRWEKSNPRIEDSCFCPVCLEKFAKYANLPLNPVTSVPEIAKTILTRHSKQWCQFRIHSIISWIKEAKALRDRLRPDVYLGLFLVPWLAEDFDNAMYRIVAQQVNELDEDIDIFSPMVYHRLCGRNVEWIAKVTHNIKEQTSKPVWPIIQAVSDPTELTENEFIQSIQIAEEASQSGVILFTAAHIQKENRWPSIQRVWGNDEGS